MEQPAAGKTHLPRRLHVVWLKKGLWRACAKCMLALKSVATQLHFPCLVWLVTSVQLQCGGPDQGAGQTGWFSPTNCAFWWGWANTDLTLCILCKAWKEQHCHSQVGMQSASSLLDGNCVRSRAGSMRLIFWEKKQCGKKRTCPDQMAANLW